MPASEPYDLLIRGGTLITATGEQRADLAIRGPYIQAVRDLKWAEAHQALDVTGLHLLPGIIDSHAHFREPGAEHKETIATGSRAAVLGGVTTVFEMPNTSPPTVDGASLTDKVRRANASAWCDMAFYVGATRENIQQLAALERMPHVSGVKLFAGSSTGSLLVDDEPSIEAVLASGSRRCAVHSEDEARLRERKALISPAPHAREHPFLRDAEAAIISTRRLLRLSAQTRRPIHILHVTTAEETALLADAKAAGQDVTCEITPQHLLLDSEAYERFGSLAQINPPIRSAEHRSALQAAAKAGLFDTFGSDHAPHTREEKARPYPDSPSGMPGVQTLAPLVFDAALSGLIDLRMAIQMLTEGPCRGFGLKGKGRLAPGAIADVAIFDLRANWELEASWLAGKNPWSPFLGKKLRARPVHTVVRGRLAVIDGQLVERAGGCFAEFE